jgi:hypothetical protein
LRWTEWRVRDRRRDGEHVHEPRRHVGEDGDRGTADEDDAGDVREKQDAFARIAIAKSANGAANGRDEAGEDEEADSRRSADSVGIDGDGDEDA